MDLSDKTSARGLNAISKSLERMFSSSQEINKALADIATEVKRGADTKSDVHINLGDVTLIKGKDGYSPVKYKDYYTDTEINEVITKIISTVDTDFSKRLLKLTSTHKREIFEDLLKEIPPAEKVDYDKVTGFIEGQIPSLTKTLKADIKTQFAKLPKKKEIIKSFHETIIKKAWTLEDFEKIARGLEKLKGQKRLHAKAIRGLPLWGGIVAATSTGGGSWGTITGLISAQTDLQTALDAKVTGPASSTDNATARFDGTTGKLIQNSEVIITDTGLVRATSAEAVGPQFTFGADFRYGIGNTINSWTDIFFHDSGSGARIGRYDGSTLTPHIYVLHGGNVGVGASPNHKLEAFKDITTAVNDDGQIVASGLTNTNKGMVFGFDTTNNIGYIYAREKGTAARNINLASGGGNIGINLTPTARLHLPAGTATASTAPFKLTTGTPLTITEDGAVEYHSSHLFFTIGSTRYQLDQQQASIGGTITGATQGSVLFVGSSSTIAQDNANFFWDDTNNRVGIKTNNPLSDLQIGTQVSTSTATPNTLSLGGTYSSTAGANSKLKLYDDGSGVYGLGVSTGQLDYSVTAGSSHVFYVAGSEKARIHLDGNVGIGITSPQQELHLKGTFRSDAKSGSDNIWFQGYNSVGTQVFHIGEASDEGGGGMLFRGARTAPAGNGIFFVGYVPDPSNAGIEFLAAGGNIDTPAALVNAPIAKFSKYNGSAIVTAMTLDVNGNLGIGTTTPTAVLHLKAGTTAANTSPFKFTSGSLNTTAEAGAMEFLTDNLYFTITTGAARKTIPFLETAQTFTATQSVTGDFKLTTAGNGHYVKEGTNATMGVATLIGGTTVVTTTKVTANSRIFLSTQNIGGTNGFVIVSARVASTSFTILSSNILDTSNVAWLIVEPA